METQQLGEARKSSLSVDKSYLSLHFIKMLYLEFLKGWKNPVERHHFSLDKTFLLQQHSGYLFLRFKICSYEILAIDIHKTEEYIVTRISPDTQSVSEHKLNAFKSFTEH